MGETDNPKDYRLAARSEEVPGAFPSMGRLRSPYLSIIENVIPQYFGAPVFLS